jgi:hypothetical protein
MHSLKLDDGRYNKVANVVGHDAVTHTGCKYRDAITIGQKIMIDCQETGEYPYWRQRGSFVILKPVCLNLLWRLFIAQNY